MGNKIIKKKINKIKINKIKPEPEQLLHPEIVKQISNEFEDHLIKKINRERSLIENKK
jgi:hypothetical protein